MKTTRKVIAACLFVLMMLFAMPGLAAPQQPKSLEANAKGKGLLTVGDQKLEIYAVVIKLKEGGDAEITLVSDVTLFFGGTWSGSDDVSKGINLKITGGAADDGVRGSGMLFLRDDAKSISRLSLQGTGRAKKNVVVTFEAE